MGEPVIQRAGPTNWLFLAVVMVMAIGATIFVYTQISEPSLPPSAQPVIAVEPVSLVLATDKREYRLGEIVRVEVALDAAGKQTAGVDISLRYDPQFLSLQTRDGRDGGQGKLDPERYLATAASAFETFPYFSANTREGTLYFSALAKPREMLSGRSLVAELIFKARKAGTTTVSLDFQPGSSRDSNVAYLGQDILGRVSASRIAIR